MKNFEKVEFHTNVGSRSERVVSAWYEVLHERYPSRVQTQEQFVRDNMEEIVTHIVTRVVDETITQEALRDSTTALVQLYDALYAEPDKYTELIGSMYDICMREFCNGFEAKVQIEALPQLSNALTELSMAFVSSFHELEANSVSTEVDVDGSKSELDTAMEEIERTQGMLQWTEHELRRAHDFLRHIINCLPDPLFVKDDNHRWILVNTAFCDFVGYTEQQLIGKSDYDIFPEEEADVFWEQDDLVFDSQQPHENEEQVTDSSGVSHTIITKKTMFVDEDGDQILIGVFRDVTEQRRIESRLSLAERMMSVGTLAAGVAHEINNPLAYVIANLDWVIEQLGQESSALLNTVSEDYEGALLAAREGAERVRRIVHGMRSFAWGGEEEERIEAVDVNDALDGAIELTWNEIRHHARLEKHFEQVSLVAATKSRLIQVFVNLFLNAAQAIPEGEASRHLIRVVTYEDKLGRVIIEVHDTGEGISRAHLKRIFDPFFTTKPVGVGTGLGLSICHNIIEGFGGHIEVESKVGKGSVFRIVLPSASDLQVNDQEENILEPATTKRRVLIIDDESELLLALTRLLPEHDVTTCESAAEGLFHIQHGQHFDVILCDLMMPEITGMDFYERTLNDYPELCERIIFSRVAHSLSVPTRLSKTLQTRFWISHSIRAACEKLLSKSLIKMPLRKYLARNEMPDKQTL